MFGGETGFLHALGWAVVNSFWQMALLWVIFQIIAGFKSVSKPGLKAGLASILLITGFCWFLFTFFSFYFNPATFKVSIDFSILFSANSISNNEFINISLLIISFVYLMILFVRLRYFISNYRYVQVIRRHGKTKIDIDWRIFVRKIAARMGILRPVHIWVSEFVSSPVTIGFLKPVILVPLAAINQLTTQQMEAVLLHELSHIRRSDYLINLFINLIQTILYFNPFVNAFIKVVEREREKSCDEMVLQFQYDSYDYASALLTLEKTGHNNQLFALASGGNRNDLLHRIETMLKIKSKNTFSYRKMAGFITSVLLITGLNVLFFFYKPGNNINKSPVLAYISDPFTQMSGGTFQKQNDPFVYANNKKTTDTKNKIINNPENDLLSDNPEIIPELYNKEIQPSISNDIIPVCLETNIAPVLDKHQEYQVQEALAASRKVLENAQWKVVEKNIADVFTEKEKEKLKTEYHNEISKFDWDKWENKLRLAYTNVDWDNVNYQLSNAVNQIKIDSLQKVFNNVVVELNLVQKELSANGIKGIPDTDITIKEVEKKKLEALRTLNNLKSIRNKKVVHL